ncbi:hypothetical protein [Paenibacillus sp. R14(2021)]|uniref:hypothetical protein n=1 Tax=Paenibacillus sp. R14(2021) TaxID=2859228 RepID=UPI001C616426|nr:hypothetical protein [Paenibacillus sp. R14(2021)]
MKEEWIDAAKLLATDPTISIKCPDCKDHVLIEVVDIDSPLNTVEFETYMTCPRCKAQAVLRLQRKEA